MERPSKIGARETGITPALPRAVVNCKILKMHGQRREMATTDFMEFGLKCD